MILFDYVFYKLSKFYMKWDGKDSSIPIFGVISIQIMLLVDLVMIVLRFIIGQNVLKQLLNETKIFFGLLFILLCFYNFRRYKNKFDFFEEKWGSEAGYKSRVKGILVLFFLILPWAILYMTI